MPVPVQFGQYRARRIGEIRAETQERDDDEIEEDNISPTFIARGD